MSTATYENLTFPSHGDTAEAETELPDLDDQDLEDAETDEEEADTSAEDTVLSSDPAAKAKNQAKSNRALIRRAAAKTVEVLEAGEGTRVLAATLVGSSPDPVDLATAIMTAPRTSQTAAADLDEIATALKSDASWEAGIIAASLERGALKDVWTLLFALDAVGAPTPPAAIVKASGAIVKATASLTDESKAELAAAGELIKRS
ncbi:MAG TPA: hypothetical protein VF867_10145 [Arthrobacter sp.]